MLIVIKRIALSVALLLYVTVNPQAHSPDLFPVGDHARQPQSRSSTTDHEPLDGFTNLSAPRTMDFRPAPIQHVRVAEANAPFPIRDHVATASLRKPGRSLAPVLRSAKPSQLSKASVKPRNSPAFLLVASEKRSLILNSRYRLRTGRDLMFTSGYRTPYRQARAIHRNLRAYGTSYVLSMYRRGAAIREIVAAYKCNRRRPEKAVTMMTRVIEAQVRRGIYVSGHMQGLAFDVRSKGRHGANLSALRAVAQSMGARVLVEKNHYHVEL